MKRTLITGATVALLAQGAWAQSSARLTQIEVKPLGPGLEVYVKGDALGTPRTQRVLRGTSYIVEFDAHLGIDPKRETITAGHATFVEWGWFTSRPAKVRVHIKLEDGETPIRVDKEEGAYVVRINLPTDKAALTALRTQQNGVNSLVTPPTANQVTGPQGDVSADGRTSFGQMVNDLATGTTPPVQTPPVQTPPTEVKPPVEVKPTETKPPVEEKKEEPARTIPSPRDLPLPTRPLRPVTPVEAPAVPAQTPAQVIQSNTLAARNGSTNMQRQVSLDFVDTDVVQILKALALQADVNIVTSPKIGSAGNPTNLTLSLTKVTLEEALSFITAMAGLRYARVDSTFVVTPAGELNDTMRQILERSNNYETRVVNLMSGDAKQIREATLKAFPQDGREGYYDVMVPEAQMGSGPVTAPPAGANGAAQADGQAAPPQAAPPVAPTGRVYYVMIMGDKSRLDSIEKYVRELDNRITNSFSVSRAEDLGTVVVPIQSGDTERIKTMLERLLADNPRRADYSIQQTALSELSEADQATQMLLMIGPKSEVAKLEAFASELDRQLCGAVGITYVSDAGSSQRGYEVLELKYIEPMVAEFDLKNRIRGLHVTVVPDPVTPGITGEDEGKKAEDPQTAGQGQAGGAGQGGGGGTNREAELRRQIGREPMRLVVRGTPDQIAQAKAYLALVDVAPRQVALELRVLELSKEDAFKMGLDWNLLTGGRLSQIRFNQNPGGQAALPGSISGNFNFNQGPSNFLGVLDQLAGGNKLIARPNALVSDGRGTRLFVGDTIRYIKQIQASQSGTTVITDELEVGALFDIKARVGAEGAIALDLEQNFSILTSFLPVPGGGQLPQTSDRRTSMFVNMKSGETIAIGGLILDQDRKTVSGIPILKDLPIIGRLFFSRTETSRDRTEIVFFLTAKVVNEDNRDDAASPRRNETAVPDPMKDYTTTGGNP